MKTKISVLAAIVAGAVIVVTVQLGLKAMAAEPEVPPPPDEIRASPKKWDALDFEQTIPVEWGTVISINRVEKGGESYTFWFLGTDGTLRGITTREFSGPNRASFFPEVYVIRRR